MPKPSSINFRDVIYIYKQPLTNGPRHMDNPIYVLFTTQHGTFYAKQARI